MKYFTICVFVFALTVISRADDDLVASASDNSDSRQEISGAESSLRPLQEKHQEKRYAGVGGYNGIGGYGGYGGYGTGLDSSIGGYGGYGYNPYQSRLGLDGYPGYNGGYNGYSGGLGGYSGSLGGYSSGLGGYSGGYGGYGAAGAYTGGYSSYPYNSYNSYNRIAGAYPYARPSYAGYSSYPSSYYSSNYANSIVGGGLGALGTPGFVPSVAGAAGYQYGPGISGTVY